MTIDNNTPANERNKFCELQSLRNESDVEQFFAIRLLHDLGSNDSLIMTKATIEEITVGKGQKRSRIVLIILLF